MEKSRESNRKVEINMGNERYIVEGTEGDHGQDRYSIHLSLVVALHIGLASLLGHK